jgi:hypothetical protein
MCRDGEGFGGSAGADWCFDSEFVFVREDDGSVWEHHYEIIEGLGFSDVGEKVFNSRRMICRPTRSATPRRW